MFDWRAALHRGLVIPAHPLALTADRKLDERRQRALTRYYLDSGAGGVAVGVHTTQFQIRQAGLYPPVLQIAAEELKQHDVVRIAGICGDTRQAVKEAALARDLGYHAGLLSMASATGSLIAHARAVGEIIPLFGFYLQPAVGGRVLPYDFWREFAQLESVVAIKVAPFNRYQTLDVIRATAGSGIALYTGNDDHIVHDLLSGHFAGGLLGHWAVWTSKAAEMFKNPAIADAVTDMNGALFDASNGFRGCIAGIHEVLRRQGLLEGIWCLDPNEGLSPGQAEELDRVYRLYPELTDDEFVKENLDRWLKL